MNDLDVELSESGLIIELYPPKSAGVFRNEVITDDTFNSSEELKILEGICEGNQEKFNPEE